MAPGETTQMSINWWEDKFNVANPYAGILFSHKKEWGTDTCDMDELCKHYARWKKPDIKNNILYGSVYMKYPK
jgi:hypothetical protein